VDNGWLKYLPVRLQHRLEDRLELQKIITNIGWLFGDKILRMGVGLVVGVWLARYLGPCKYGQLNYAIAFVSMFSALSALGLNGIVVRDLVRLPDESNIILGSAFVLQLCGGTGAFLCAGVAIQIIRPQDATMKLLVLLLSIIMVFKSTDIIRYWFESKVQSKYSVMIENVAFLCLSIGQVILMVTHASLQSFVWALVVESLLVALGLPWIYCRVSGRLLSDWKPQWKRAKMLLVDSWPLILSGLAIMMYMRIDQIMLGQMLGDKAVGVYSAAVRISEVWYFIPAVLVPTVFPALIQAKKESEERYNNLFQKFYDGMVLLALLVAIPMTFLSDWLIVFLFGNEFKAAGIVLAIHIWTGVFAFLGGVSARWFLIEGLQRFSFYRAVIGVFVSICINFYAIPKYGALGAAVGTLSAQFFAIYIFDLFHPTTRQMFIMKTKAIFIIFRYKIYLP
jgi:PST family polysaccharide transporter